MMEIIMTTPKLGDLRTVIILDGFMAPDKYVPLASRYGDGGKKPKIYGCKF